MTIEQFRAHFSSELSDLYESDEISSLCFLTFNHVMGMNRVEVSLSRNMELSQSDVSKLSEVLDELKKTIPIQYIIGKTEFYGLDFQVNPATLIPRPETEELLDWVLTTIKTTSTSIKVKTREGLNHKVDPANTSLRILDIGTGSGCIAIAIAKNLPKSIVHATDISQNALATAYQNAKANQTDVQFYDQNILEAEVLDPYDIIVSNPPYVRMLEKPQMHGNVINNEPESALYVSDRNPLIFYRKIGKLAFKSLSKQGLLFFEINEYLGVEMIDLLRNIGFENVELRKDMFGKDRMVKATR